MSARSTIEHELATIRSDPRYGIDGVDGDLLQRELELLIAQVHALEAEGALQRRKRRRYRREAPSQPQSASRTSS